MQTKIIEIEHLVKTFGEVTAVNDISFCVKNGELFAFLGLNGAGKSTTINIMCNQLTKDSGTVIIDGVNIDEQDNHIKSELGVVYQNSLLDKVLNVIENLKSRAALYGITGVDFEKRLAELDQLLNIAPLYRRTVSKLSGGERRRVDIARALIHNPKILILDEPTTGLDPQTRKTVWSVIDDLRKKQGMTVFLTTHYMEEASDADYVVILDSGNIVAHGTPIDLKNQYTGDFITIYNVNEEDLQKLADKYEVVTKGYRFEVVNTTMATQLITEYPDIFVDYEVTKGKMDDVFLAVTGKKLGNGEK